MATESDNCLICAQEYPMADLKPVALSTVNVTKFKICVKCLNSSDPADDYREVRSIVNAFFKMDEKFIK